MKKTFFPASSDLHRSYSSENKFQNTAKNRFSAEAVVVFSLLLLSLAFLAVSFFTAKTTAAPLFQQNWQVRYAQPIGGADISDSEFNAAPNSIFNIEKISIYRNGADRTADITLPVFPAEGRLTSGFGGRGNPFGAGGGEFHAGLDVAAPVGTGVTAAADGVVTFSGWKGGYGNVIIIEHDGQAVVTRYGHLSRRYVEAGDTVTAGRLIGAVGSTGRSTGPHLHFEVRIDGKPTNPLTYYSQK